MKNNDIQKLEILSTEGTNIFSTDKYVIPLYQRAFAWENSELEQLLDDIGNFETSCYYLGTLIVFKRNDGKFEIIDGQQRLTALFLLLLSLGIPFADNALSFEYRQKSDDTLAQLKKMENEDWRRNADGGIASGFDAISKKLGREKTLTSKIKKKLCKVTLVRVAVPPDTDLNKYFEIMNNRGEQLEQQDIVKARLIERIQNNTAKREAFSRVWEACSDMSGYVQMHFAKRERDHYFGREWNRYPQLSKNYYLNTDNNHYSKLYSINAIASNASITSSPAGAISKADEESMRFESFVSFRHFLLHVLNIFKHRDSDKQFWGGELIDDKKLIQRFEELFSHKPGVSNKILEFGICLLQCRFLFDNFMLKREFKNNDTDGKWSIKELRVSSSTGNSNKKNQPKAYYTDLQDSIELRMLQSLLRVTYTSPLTMHWVTEFLAYLYINKPTFDSAKAVEKLEGIAKVPVKEFLDQEKYSLGLNTPHVVLNYLDYLLWKKNMPDFQFEFRNSIEHWYPQNPIDSNVRWEADALNHFGNLCLVSSSLNSKFSNNLPLAKKANFKIGLEKQSLKLLQMAKLTVDADAWTQKVAINHGEEMLGILKNSVKK